LCDPATVPRLASAEGASCPLRRVPPRTFHAPRYDRALDMRIRIGSRRVRTPSGVEWRVGRQWSLRGLPRWRRVGIGKGAEQTLDAAWSVPAVDAGSDSLEVLLGGIVVVVVIAVIVIPLLLFGIELITAGLLVAGGIVARSTLGRPWIVLATPSGDPAGALAWEAKGWQRSKQLIDEVAAELAAGLMPSPIEDTEQVAPGPISETGVNGVSE
jgi:hypothetical protein